MYVLCICMYRPGFVHVLDAIPFVCLCTFSLAIQFTMHVYAYVYVHDDARSIRIYRTRTLHRRRRKCRAVRSKRRTGTVGC
jgi:type IV secretory pathway VirB3-like protein